jgi:3-oxoadipate enol-lactonase
MKYQEKQIQVDGNTVSFIDEGKPGGTPLVFIHGFPFDKWMWENQFEFFKEQYRVIAYDVRGHGSTPSGTDKFTIDKFVEDLFLFMDALQIGKANICGLSMGGYIALNAIVKDPKRIASLVLCDTQCSADSEEGIKKRMDTVASVREKGLVEYSKDSLMKLFSETSLVGNQDAVRFIEQTILHTPVATICNTLMALAGRKETCSSLHLINIPVLIMVGEVDQITPLVAAIKMQAGIPGSILQVIEQAGHVSNLENPQSFNRHLKKFLISME